VTGAGVGTTGVTGAFFASILACRVGEIYGFTQVTLSGSILNCCSSADRGLFVVGLFTTAPSKTNPHSVLSGALE